MEKLISGPITVDRMDLAVALYNAYVRGQIDCILDSLPIPISDETSSDREADEIEISKRIGHWLGILSKRRTRKSGTISIPRIDAMLDWATTDAAP